MDNIDDSETEADISANREISAYLDRIRDIGLDEILRIESVCRAHQCENPPTKRYLMLLAMFLFRDNIDDEGLDWSHVALHAALDAERTQILETQCLNLQAKIYGLEDENTKLKDRIFRLEERPANAGRLN